MAAVVGALCGMVSGVGFLLSRFSCRSWRTPPNGLNFIDIAGNRDPSLAFVLAGATGITTPGCRPVLRPSHPVLGDRFALTPARGVDARLIGKAVLFGVGLGDPGVLPRPGMDGITSGVARAVVFGPAMLAGRGAGQGLRKG
ncbi:DUF6691 family protein [Mesobaculum littorinae]|uniref:DUF6691 family protein n=1 Tax=Mesobaculum littorinae TaxID=2486419 RepID=UPI0013E373DC|nr:DUF6691 family protein [Mesobaculum littorinae]